ncbi:MAG: hypothetical protein R3327_07990 [Nitrosopumilaceae archaeon]|nr:hypothetical protein [Nitrosopumilaceae archaeon]
MKKARHRYSGIIKYSFHNRYSLNSVTNRESLRNHSLIGSEAKNPLPINAITAMDLRGLTWVLDSD